MGATPDECGGMDDRCASADKLYVRVQLKGRKAAPTKHLGPKDSACMVAASAGRVDNGLATADSGLAGAGSASNHAHGTFECPPSHPETAPVGALRVGSVLRATMQVEPTGLGPDNRGRGAAPLPESQATEPQNP